MEWEFRPVNARECPTGEILHMRINIKKFIKLSIVWFFRHTKLCKHQNNEYNCNSLRFSQLFRTQIRICLRLFAESVRMWTRLIWKHPRSIYSWLVLCCLCYLLLFTLPPIVFGAFFSFAQNHFNLTRTRRDEWPLEAPQCKMFVFEYRRRWWICLKYPLIIPLINIICINLLFFGGPTMSIWSCFWTKNRVLHLTLFNKRGFLRGKRYYSMCV